MNPAPSPVSRRLRRLAAKLRTLAVVTGGGTVVVGLFVALLGQFALDYTLRLPRDMRMTLSVVLLVSLLWQVHRRVWTPWRHRFGPREMARVVEQRFPQLQSLLVSAVQFAGGQIGRRECNSPALVSAVVERAERETHAVPFESVLRSRPARRAGWAAVAVLAVSAALTVIAPQTVGLWFDRNVLLADIPWPKRTTIYVELPGGVLTGARGDDLEIRAHVEGEVPRQVEVLYELTSGPSGRESLVAVGERGFRHTFTHADQEFRFRLEGGDDVTQWFTTRLADRPRVEQVTISVVPPEYARVAPFTLPANQRAAEALLGSAVTFDVTLNKPVVRAELMAGQDVIAPATGDDLYWSVTFNPREAKTYHFMLQDDLGLVDKRPVRLSVRIVKDAPPRVRLRITGVSDMVTAQAILPVEMSFTDTYGLAVAEMHYQLAREGSTAQVVPLTDFKPLMTLFDTKLRWPLSGLGLIPGDHLSLLARAVDYDDISGPNAGQSSATTLRIVTSDELLAELARREQEFRQDFERAIEQQEQLRGQLLTLIRQLDDSEVHRELAKRVAPLERQQQQIAGQVNLLRQQFEQVLLELEINGLDTAGVRERLGEHIVQPLFSLVRQQLVDAGDALTRLGRERTQETAAAADAAQATVLAEMRRILANMLKWEGFQEAVTMLREILRLQGELNAETQQEIDRRASQILGGEDQ